MCVLWWYKAKERGEKEGMEKSCVRVLFSCIYLVVCMYIHILLADE